MATKDLFATQDLSGSYLALPAMIGAGASAVAPRKLVGYLQGEQTLVRSSNPEGYLIPDIDLFSGIGWREGTASPEATAVEMGKTGIVVHLLRGEGMVAPIVQQDQAFGGSILVFLHPESVHAEVWGPHGRVPPTLLSGSFGALESVSSMSDLAAELPADASVAEIATRIAGISNLSDGDLAQLFGVARETFQRWRTGELTKPTRANRRRLGLLLRLLADLDRREVQVSEWLRNVTEIDDLTPYELLKQGRLDDAEHLAAQLPSTSAPRILEGADGMAVTHANDLPTFAPRRNEPAEDLVLEDDEDWVEIETEAVEDDE
jgi:hypothetical protein